MLISESFEKTVKNLSLRCYVNYVLYRKFLLYVSLVTDAHALCLSLQSLDTYPSHCFSFPLLLFKIIDVFPLLMFYCWELLVIFKIFYIVKIVFSLLKELKFNVYSKFSNGHFIHCGRMNSKQVLHIFSPEDMWTNIYLSQMSHEGQTNEMIISRSSLVN